jgi:hypothetical protein
VRPREATLTWIAATLLLAYLALHDLASAAFASYLLAHELGGAVLSYRTAVPGGSVEVRLTLVQLLALWICALGTALTLAWFLGDPGERKGRRR